MFQLEQSNKFTFPRDIELVISYNSVTQAIAARISNSDELSVREWIAVRLFEEEFYNLSQGLVNRPVDNQLFRELEYGIVNITNMIYNEMEIRVVLNKEGLRL